MDTVFVVQHHSANDGENEDVKFVGVYRSLESARAAVGRLQTQPGFKDASRIVDPFKDNEISGFYIDEYQLDKNGWTEGFIIA